MIPERLYPSDPYPKSIINTAITGMVPTRAQSPHVPIDEDEIVSDAAACHRAGAAIVHLNIRNGQGNPDLSVLDLGGGNRIIGEVDGHDLPIDDVDAESACRPPPRY